MIGIPREAVNRLECCSIARNPRLPDQSFEAISSELPRNPAARRPPACRRTSRPGAVSSETFTTHRAALSEVTISNAYRTRFGDSQVRDCPDPRDGRFDFGRISPTEVDFVTHTSSYPCPDRWVSE